MFFMNMVFYGEEIRYKICKKLVMLVGEISSVEIELGFCICFCLGGIYGIEGMQ